nr:hypothetical protein [Brevundimonas diminuta]
MTPPIRMVSVPVEDLLFYKLKDLILEQSEGEWTEEMIVRDAHHFANHIRPLLTAASMREEGGAGDYTMALADRQPFEAYPALAAHIERMAVSHSVGSLIEWGAGAIKKDRAND